MEGSFGGFFVGFFGLFVFKGQRLGVKLKLQLMAYTKATQHQIRAVSATHTAAHRQHQILNPLSKARDQTCIPMDTSGVCYAEPPREPQEGRFYFFYFLFFCLFAISWAAPAAYGGSHARGRIGAVVTEL